MLLFLLAYLGGVFTILSPCILPVLPFVFARADRPFLRSGLPMLVGMAGTFAAVATLASLGGGWAVELNDYGRDAALLLLALFGIVLLFPALSDRLTQPLVASGSRLANIADARAATGGSQIGPSLLLGVATGMLWAPCAGPVLGLILTGAAIHGANVGTSVLLLCYAAGAATSLALALLVGGRAFVLMKRSLGVSHWIRRIAGGLVLASVVAVATGVDTGFLTRVSTTNTASLEQMLIDRLHPHIVRTAAAAAPAVPMQMQARPAPVMAARTPAATPASAPAPAPTPALPVEGPFPSLAGATTWLNSPPLTVAQLRGKVVLVDFWTYSCINCLRSLPYVEAWSRRYASSGLVVIGVHAPEFAFEKNVDNVRRAIASLGITYPVAVDNDYAIWRAFNNEYWPAHYFIDANGNIRHHHFGEGEYAQSEQVIRALLTEAGHQLPPDTTLAITAQGAEAPSDASDLGSEETYIGYDRASGFASPGGEVRGTADRYTVGKLGLNQWGLFGEWTVAPQLARLDVPDGGVCFRFHARDLHLVLGPDQMGHPVRFHITIDAHAPGDSHGADTDATGAGTVTSQRLYQLVRQDGTITDHDFAITFDAPVDAYSFTFG